jgi:hypothetical protein
MIRQKGEMGESGVKSLTQSLHSAFSAGLKQQCLDGIDLSVRRSSDPSDVCCERRL